MQKRKLGNSDMQITPIGVGAWAMGGGGWQFSWGPQDDSQSIAAINAALDQGINWIDTAAVYGLDHSEELSGRHYGTEPPGLMCSRNVNACGTVKDALGDRLKLLPSDASAKQVCAA